MYTEAPRVKSEKLRAEAAIDWPPEKFRLWLIPQQAIIKLIASKTSIPRTTLLYGGVTAKNDLCS